MRVAKNAVFPFDKHSYCSEKRSALFNHLLLLLLGYAYHVVISPGR